MKTYILISFFFLFISCSENNNSSSLKNTTNEEPLSNIHIFSKDENELMKQAYKNMLDSIDIKNIYFPSYMLIEKQYIQLLLNTIENKTGGLVFYPIINSDSSVSISLAAAQFKIDSSGEILSDSNVDIIYPLINNQESVIERVHPCPPFCNN